MKADVIAKYTINSAVAFKRSAREVVCWKLCRVQLYSRTRLPSSIAAATITKNENMYMHTIYHSGLNPLRYACLQ